MHKSQEDLENDIILLHQLEDTIVNEIEKSKVYPKLLHVWEVCVALLEDYKCFQHIGLKPALARGLIAEIMCKYIIKHWAQENNKDCRIFSNLLIPRADGKGTTQVDLLVLSNDFGLCIECKSLYGRMSIKNGEIKTTTMPKAITPWKQNFGHIMSLKNVLSDYDLYLHNFVYIFSFGYILAGYELKPEEQMMVPVNSLTLLSEISKDHEYYHRKPLSTNDLDRIEQELTQYIPEVQKEVEHVRFVNELIGDIE